MPHGEAGEREADNTPAASRTPLRRDHARRPPVIAARHPPSLFNRLLRTSDFGELSRVASSVESRAQSSRDNREQLAKPALSLSNGLPDRCIDLIGTGSRHFGIDPALVSPVDPPFNSNRNYEVFWGEMKEKRSFEDRHASTQAYIDYMRPRCIELARVLVPFPVEANHQVVQAGV